MLKSRGQLQQYIDNIQQSLVQQADLALISNSASAIISLTPCCETTLPLKGAGGALPTGESSGAAEGAG